MHVIAFHQLARSVDGAMLAMLHDVAARHGHRGVFNPSFGMLGEQMLFAYRAIPETGIDIRSYVAVREEPGAGFAVTDLTAIGEDQGLVRVADPKVVDAGDALYVTFNTGFSAESDNDLFLVQVLPRLGAFQRVVADFDRQRVEKNWAFILGGEGTPRAIYQLHPYREVHLSAGELGSTDDLHFSLRRPLSASSKAAANLSIGTQLIGDGAGGHLLIAHEKWSVRGKRSYFGRAVRVKGTGGDEIQVDVGSRRLIHRWRDALPRRTAHNRNLLSATYFSGLLHDGDEVIVGYGVNDATCSIARMKATDLWS